MGGTPDKPAESLTRQKEIEEVFRTLNLGTAAQREDVLRPLSFEEPERAPVYYAIRVSGTADVALESVTLPHA